MRTNNWPALCGRERIRFRDEYEGTGRLVVTDRADGDPGVVLVMPEEDAWPCGTVHILGPWDVELLIRALQEKAAADAIQMCPWCDSLGMVDGADGRPQFCDHPPPGDAAGR